MSVLLGSQYVNDFDFNNRAYRVYVQGDQQFRAQPADLSQYYAQQQAMYGTIQKQMDAAYQQQLAYQNQLTQMQLSNRCGVDMGEISRIERGMRDPQLSTIVRVAHGLHVAPAELLAGIP